MTPMTSPPRIPDESVLQRWMRIEIAKMNGGVVTERKPLAALLAEETPAAVTRNGDPYHFDRTVIGVLGRSLPEDLHRKLRLPILFSCSPDTPGSCSCTDPAALETLRMLGEVSPMRTSHGGRFWVSRPIVLAIMQKYPTAVQIIMGI